MNLDLSIIIILCVEGRKGQYTHNLRANNDKYVKSVSTKILTDHETALLAKGLKFIPTTTKPASHKNLLKDFEAFSRSMRLQYSFANSKSKPHSFHVKSTWQTPPQPSVASESYLERTKYEIASITFFLLRDNLSAKQRQALKPLRTNSEVNLKKADKGTTTVIMDTKQKIQEGLQQVSKKNFYKPLTRPIVSETATRVVTVINALFTNGHIDQITHKWLNLVLHADEDTQSYSRRQTYRLW